MQYARRALFALALLPAAPALAQPWWDERRENENWERERERERRLAEERHEHWDEQRERHEWMERQRGRAQTQWERTHR